MTPFDYKKEYKALYLPKEMPSIVEVPSMQYAAVRGHGDPNEPDGEYGRAVAVLYGISYTIKMSYKGSRKVDGFFEEVFAWAKEEAQRKKGIDTSLAELITVSEGLCVQCLHIGSYNEEPATVAKMDRYLLEQGYENDISDLRRHHEIYLSDPRKVSPERMKTVIRHPVRPKID